MKISDPSVTVLYVTDSARSKKFYADLLGREPVESSPNFSGFALASGGVLGLWNLAKVQPVTKEIKSSSELCFMVESRDEVSAIREDWKKRGMPIAQEPAEMDFGYTFVALDPDGHRLRVIAQNQ